MGEAKDKLKALLGTANLMTGAQWQAQAAARDERRASGAYEIHTQIPGEILGETDDAFYLVRRDFPLDTPHGRAILGHALEAAAEHVALSATDQSLGAFNPQTAVFVDTETTGLAGGTGTVTFLVGVGYFTGETFRLDQCFMRDYDDEEPMLAFLAERFRQAETIVSYNGKSFDLPLLKTRFIANRMRVRLDGLLHFDLVHAARRFWKKRLGDCSLGNVERHVLGIHRHGDVDSARIPQLWLDYLHSRDARSLKPVFYHHQMDILSLVGLTALLGRTLAVPDGQGFEHEADQLSLLRVHFRQKQYQQTITLANRLQPVLASEPLRHECLEMMGYAAKRIEDWELMVDTWRALLAEFPRHTAAWKELAIYYEHRARDLAQAERVCEEALLLAEAGARQASQVNAISPAADFRRRLERIRRKRARYRTDGL